MSASKSVIKFVSEQDEESSMDGRSSEGVGEAEGRAEIENGEELKRKFLAMEEENTGLKERVKLLEEQVQVKDKALERMRMAELELKKVKSADLHQRLLNTSSAAESEAEEGEEARWRNKNPEFYEHDYNDDVKEEGEDEEDSAEETDGDSDVDVEVLKTSAKMLSSGPGLLRPYTVEEGRCLGGKLRGLGRKLKNLKKCQQLFYLKKVENGELREHLKFWELRCVTRKGNMERLQSAHDKAMEKMREEFQSETEKRISAAEAEVRKMLTVDQQPKPIPVVTEVATRELPVPGVLPLVTEPVSPVGDVRTRTEDALLEDDNADSFNELEVDEGGLENMNGNGAATSFPNDATKTPVPGLAYNLRRKTLKRYSETKEGCEEELGDVIDKESDLPPHQPRPNQSSWKTSANSKSTTLQTQTQARSRAQEKSDSWRPVRRVEQENGSSSDRKQFKCARCSETFSSEFSSRRHLKIVHERVRGQGQFPCNVCGKRFHERSHLRQHVQTHELDRKGDFVCPTCSKTFSTSSHLARHEVLHRPDTPFKCPHCPSQFKHAERLKKHLKVHSEQRPFQCELCEKSFKRSDELVLHTRVHTGERPYSCHICKKTFSRSSNLIEHLRRHQGDEGRIHQCPFCDLAFVRTTTLRDHQKRLHKSELEPREDESTSGK